MSPSPTTIKSPLNALFRTHLRDPTVSPPFSSAFSLHKAFRLPICSSCYHTTASSYYLHLPLFQNRLPPSASTRDKQVYPGNVRYHQWRPRQRGGTHRMPRLWNSRCLRRYLSWLWQRYPLHSQSSLIVRMVMDVFASPQPHDILLYYCEKALMNWIVVS